LFVQAARQGAVNLTTINWNEADADVRRILDSATGTFHDDFAQRSQPFVDVIKQSRSITEGTVTASGLESASENEAQVMVSVSVKTSSAAAPHQDPRSWRMRIAVQKVGDDVKVSKVEFV
jgi:Mce-associated membrane protein